MIEFKLPIKREPRDDEDPFLTKYRYVIYFLIFSILAAVIIIPSLPKPPDAVETGGTPETVPENAFFKPPDESAREVTLRGKIKRLSSAESLDDATHELVDRSGKQLSYLYSKKHDLDLTSNIDVAITGKLIKSLKNVSLIEVETIKTNNPNQPVIKVTKAVIKIITNKHNFE